MSTSRSRIYYKENVDLTESELLDLAQAMSLKSGGIQEKLLHWDFGPLMTMKYDVDAKNYLFSEGPVPFHWDGAFAKEPRKLLFYCTESEGAGGETLFVDTELLWLSLTDEERSECRNVMLTYTTAKLAHYGGSITVPMVQQHPETGATIIRLAERVETALNPVCLSISGTRNGEVLYEKMVKRMYDMTYAHSWKKGDLLCVDNHTFLHGRNPLGQNRSRSFKRLQIL